MHVFTAICLIIAAILFLLASFKIERWNVNFTALGLFFFVLPSAVAAVQSF